MTTHHTRRTRSTWVTPLSLALGAALLLTALGFSTTFVYLNRVAALSGESITGWSFSEFVRQAAEVTVLVSRGAPATQLERPLAILQSKGQVAADEQLVDQLPVPRRAALRDAVQELQRLTPAQLGGPDGPARMDRVMEAALSTYGAALHALNVQRSGIAANLRSAERALAGLGLLLLVISAVTVWLLLRNAASALQAEVGRTRAAEQARAALEAAQVAAQRDRDFAVQLTETMGEGLIVTDAQGHFTYVNPAFSALVDRPAASLLGEAARQTLPDLHLPTPPLPVGAGRSETRRVSEITLRRADGQDRQVLVTAVPWAPGGQIAVLTDLTDLKRAQGRLRALYDVAATPETALPGRAAGTPDPWHRTVMHLLQLGHAAFGGTGAYAVTNNGAWQLTWQVGADSARTPAVHADLLAGAAQTATRSQGCSGGVRGDLNGHVIAVPVRLGGHVVGALAFHRVLAPFTAADEDYLRLIGQWAQTQAERQQADALLRSSEARLKAIIGSSLDAIITGDAWGVITEFNPAAEQLFGVDRDHALGRRMVDLIVPDGLRPAHERSLARIRQGGPHPLLGQRLELVARRADGQDFPVELSVARLPTEPPSYAGFLRDITERRAAEAKLRDRTVQLDSVFKVSPDGFVTFGPDGRITEANPAFEVLTGLTGDDLIGLDEDGLEHLLAARSGAAPLAGLGGDAIEVTRPARRVLKRATRAMQCAAGEGLGQVMYFRDITPEADVSLMKSEFLSTAAHELRTPMTSIYGFTELLLTRSLDQDTTRDLLDTIYRQAGRLIVLLGELLDLARIEARDRQDFEFLTQPLAPLVRGAARAFTPPGENPRLHVQVPDDLHGHVDAAKFQQALGNLLSNAFKYSPQGGAVQVQVDASPQGVVTVQVRDEGIGLTPEQGARAFDRFYRADASGRIPGTGLGLSLVQEIMRCHGGQAALTSVPGRGTTVSLHFPPAASVPHSPSPLPTPAGSP